MDLAAATRLSSIVTQMEQLQTQIQDRRRQPCLFNEKLAGSGYLAEQTKDTQITLPV